MSESATLLPLVEDDLSKRPECWEHQRIEKREKVVRIVEYSPYPRMRRDQRRLVGFTRDESESGMCILTRERERTGDLLRVAVRGVDGDATREALARVVWCDGRPDGRYWIGLCLTETLDAGASVSAPEDVAIGA